MSYHKNQSNRTFGINYAGTQATQWDFQNKGKSGWTGTLFYVLEFTLCNLRPSRTFAKSASYGWGWLDPWLGEAYFRMTPPRQQHSDKRRTVCRYVYSKCILCSMITIFDHARWQHTRKNPRHVSGAARIYDVRMARFILKIQKLSHIIGPRGSQDLRSPSPIMAPGKIYGNRKIWRFGVVLKLEFKVKNW